MVIPQNVKKSQNHCTLLYRPSLTALCINSFMYRSVPVAKSIESLTSLDVAPSVDLRDWQYHKDVIVDGNKISINE